MREPLPILTGATPIVGVYLTLFLGLNHQAFGLSVDNLDKLVAFTGVASLIIGQLFNFIFHALWQLYVGGYQGFGWQRGELQRGRAKEDVAADYDQRVYSNKDSQSIEYIRRRNGGYMLYLQLKYALIFFSVVFAITSIAMKHDLLSVTFSLAIVSISLLFAIGCHECKELTHREVKRFEENIFCLPSSDKKLF